MKIPVVVHILGILLLALAGVQLIPLAVAYLYGSTEEFTPFFWSIGISAVTGAGFFLVFRRSSVERNLRMREGFAIVALGWTVISAFGSIPYVISGELGPLDAYFETMSGFTTTGASIHPNPSELPRGILFWRSFTHWFGGMGIVVLAVAILPFLGAGGYKLMFAEVPGPTADRLAPRIAATAKYLWLLYLALTVLHILFLLPSMDLYDAACHAFGTLATGGFSTQDTSIEGFDSAYVEWVIIAFMFLAGVNFALHIRLLKGGKVPHFQDSEFRFYAGLVCSAIVLVTILLYTSSFPDRDTGKYDGVFGCIRYASFQVMSIVTTTGYATANFDQWPNACRFLLLLLMFIGGCAGSTGGGVKCMRVLLLIKYGIRELVQILYPKAVLNVRVNGVGVDREVVGRVMGFFALWLVVFAVAVLLMNLILIPDTTAQVEGTAFETAFTSVLATMGNIGPGIADVGPYGNYADLPDIGKIILLFCMLLGRLEIYCVLILFMPAFWK